MSERDLWNDLRKRVAPFGRMTRIENSCDLGTPDVCYLLKRYPTILPVCGWLELKHVHRWPPRGPLRIESLTKEQVLWHEDWAAAGGRVFTLLRVETDHFLFGHTMLRHIFGGKVLAGALNNFRINTPLSAAEVIKCLTN